MSRLNIVLILIWVVVGSTSAQTIEMAHIKAGSYVPLYGADTSRAYVKDFYLDVLPVTKAEYLEFVSKNPKWQKSQAKALFADKSYLYDWTDDVDYGDANDKEPITYVSWFAARDYCRFQGKRLPTVDEWEYVAMADQRDKDAREKESYNQYILSWYERPKKKGETVGNTFKNYWGVYDMHGLVWEWTQDFSSVMIASESRSGGNDNNLFCSAAAVGATDLMNYAAFMRYAFRSSVKATYSGSNLGFRCAKDIE